MTAHARAALAYHIATGRTLEDREAVLVWSLGVIESGPLCSDHNRRAVEAMIPWLDSLPLDDDTRARLGLEPKPIAEMWPAWVKGDDGRCRLFLSLSDFRYRASHSVALVGDGFWSAWRMPGSLSFVDGGPETGTAGMDAAEAALRRAGVLAEGVTVRRPGGGA